MSPEVLFLLLALFISVFLGWTGLFRVESAAMVSMTALAVFLYYFVLL